MIMARLLGTPGHPNVYPEPRDAVMMEAENSMMTIRIRLPGRAVR